MTDMRLALNELTDDPNNLSDDPDDLTPPIDGLPVGDSAKLIDMMEFPCPTSAEICDGHGIPQWAGRYVDTESSSSPDATHAGMWSMFTHAHVGFDDAIEFFDLRRVSIRSDLAGVGYAGCVRIGVHVEAPDAMSPSRWAPDIIDDHNEVLARVRPDDWAAKQLATHIGDTAECRMFAALSRTHCHPTPQTAVVWRHGYAMPWKSITDGHAHPMPTGIAICDAAEMKFALGQPMTFVISKDRCDDARAYDNGIHLATLPSIYANALWALHDANYPLKTPFALRYIGRNSIDGKNVDVAIIEGPTTETMALCAKARTLSGLDIRLDDICETIEPPRRDAPFTRPFGTVHARWVSVDMPNRVHPRIDLLFDDEIVWSVKYRNDDYDAWVAYAKRDTPWWCGLYHADDD